jgi:hypothetical protein
MNDDEYDHFVMGEETFFEWIFGAVVTVGVITAVVITLVVTL